MSYVNHLTVPLRRNKQNVATQRKSALSPFANMPEFKLFQMHGNLLAQCIYCLSSYQNYSNRA